MASSEDADRLREIKKRWWDAAFEGEATIHIHKADEYPDEWYVSVRGDTVLRGDDFLGTELPNIRLHIHAYADLDWCIERIESLESDLEYSRSEVKRLREDDTARRRANARLTKEVAELKRAAERSE